MRDPVVAPFPGGDETAVEPEDHAQFLAVERDRIGLQNVPLRRGLDVHVGMVGGMGAEIK